MGSFAQRRWPVRFILIGIVFVLVLPGMVFCSVLLTQFAKSEREQSRTEALAVAIRTGESLDRELGSMAAAMRVLSTSAALRVDDLAAFDAEARLAAEAIGQHIVLIAPSGQQLINTRLPAGAQLPITNPSDAFRQVMATGTAAVSDLFLSVVGQHPRIALIMPILREGQVVSGLGLYIDPNYISAILRDQALPPGWVASVVDGKNRVFARNQDPERFLGQPVPQDFQMHATGLRSVWTGTSMEGTPVLAAAAKIKLTDWRVAVGVPISIVDEPVRNTVAILAAGGSLTLLLGCFLAWQLASTISRPLQRLALAGQALGDGRAIGRISSRIAEVDAVSGALVQATADLRARAAALAAERAQLAAIIETVPVGLLIAEAPSGRVVAGNGQLDRMLRRSPRHRAEADQRTAFDAEGLPIPSELHPLARALAGADNAELQCRYRRGDGSLFWVQCVGAAIRGAGGDVTGAVVALLDIDEVVRGREERARWAEGLEAKVAVRTAELKAANQRLRDEILARSKAEEQLRQAQKVEAVGRLTGGIAHDFNNMLTVIVGSLDLLRRRATDPRSTRLLDNAMEGANRAATLTARLLAFSRQQPLAPQSIDVNRLVSGMSDLLHRTLGETIQVETVLASGAWQAHADPNQLENALLNLAVNARDAILEASPTGGRLTIETGNAWLDDVYASQYADVRAGQYVIIAATDTGTGMTDDVLTRVFEPFFTTKPQGQGTGLGLSQVHGFVKQSGGHVGIYTEPGRGTTVKIYLPRMEAQKPATQSPPIDQAEDADRTGETILVVEDEEGVRRFTTEALRELGYAVLEASGGAAALGLLDAHPETALLFTDVVMPQMGGRELAEEAVRRRPGLPVLYTTGYTRNSIVHNGQLDAGVDLIGKPFTLMALGMKVRDVLNRVRQPATASS